MSKIYAPDKPPPEEFLAHFGVKGMKWGVRKENDSKKTIKTTSIKPLTVDEINKAQRSLKVRR